MAQSAMRAAGSIASPNISKGKTKRLRGAAKKASARARDLELRVCTLLADGKTASAIARALGIARSSVHRIINRVEQHYHKAIFATVEQMKSAQARILERAIDEAMDGWERSKTLGKRVKKTTGKRLGTGDGAEMDVT
jgi:hypothetical protein